MLEIVRIENILVNQEPNNWEESISIVGQLLENAGSINAKYTEAMIEAVKQHRAKNGKMMAFLQVSDDTDNKDVVVFNNVYEKIKDQLEVGAVVLIKVQVKETDSIIVRDMFTFEN